MNKCVLVYSLFFAGLIDSGSGTPSLENVRAYSPDLCEPLVIAHRGASGYVPEHTLGAYALAVTMGADYIEPDLVMTKDGHLIARHENELSLTTDVTERPEFSNRYRSQTVNGQEINGWFSEDFTLDEIKSLRAKELLPTVRPGNTRMDSSFDIPTMKEIIELAKGLEVSEKRVIGVYPEIKHGAYFQNIGLGMEKPLVDLLHENGYRGFEAPIYIQSFEVNNLKELKSMTDLRLLQLISSSGSSQPYDQVLAGTGLTYGQMATAEGLREIAMYAAAVGPEKSIIIPRTINNTLGTPTTFVRDAHAAGLKVHPYTFRAENPYLPVEFRTEDNINTSLGDSVGEMTAYLQTGIDGLFTDQPDILVNVRGPCIINDTGESANSETRYWLSNYLLFYLLLAFVSDYFQYRI